MTTYVIVDSYMDFEDWCHKNDLQPLSRDVVPLINSRQAHGKRWQDGDRLVIIDRPVAESYWWEILLSCGMPLDVAATRA